MDSLIKRLQEAESGAQELDALMAVHVMGWIFHDREQTWELPEGSPWPAYRNKWGVPHWTTSLDAAVALIGEKLPGWKWSAGTTVGGSGYGCVEDDDQDAEDELGFDGWASTPALSLCIALLAALQSQDPTPPHIEGEA